MCFYIAKARKTLIYNKVQACTTEPVTKIHSNTFELAAIPSISGTCYTAIYINCYSCCVDLEFMVECSSTNLVTYNILT